ncbi:VOC family protein [Paenibacillus mendelii]|uniref:VOC family protein n=1 Tax=Paenibacillus mendelii TaxID=206163 RepID=A0ABV6JEF7_9BACL|nr:VOC family protein [Paenibacillus mendelii]MCQ6557170.1 VOC family protein [Paenibacillus mendelii]
MTNQTIAAQSYHPETISSFASAVIPALYVSDLNQALLWYCRCLGFKVMAYNPHFATVEVAPGRICWINQNKEKVGQGRFDFHVPNTDAFHQHLVQCGADVSELEVGVANTLWFEFRDPDGNEFGAWSGLFGLNELEYHAGPEIPSMERYTLVSRPELHVAGCSVTVHVNDPESALAEGETRLSEAIKDIQGVKSTLFYVNPILERYEDVLENELYVCVELESPSVDAKGLTVMTIPSQCYAVFTYPRTKTDFRADYSDKYRWLGCQFGFEKQIPGQATAVHLEYSENDHVYVYIPYKVGEDVQHDYR